MHRLSRMKLYRQCCEFVDKRVLAILQEKVDRFNASGDPDDYLRMIYNCPSGLMLTARMTTNYRQLKTIYAQRKDHRLPEWRAFCEWIKTLPHSEFITGKAD